MINKQYVQQKTALFDGKGEEGGEGRREGERWVQREFIMNEEGSAIT